MRRRDVSLGIGVALAAIFGASLLPLIAQAGAVQLLAKGGTRCVFHRDGKALGELRIPAGGTGSAKGIGLVGPLVFDSNASHADILVSCSLGDAAEAQVLRYRRIVGEWMGPLCVTTKPDEKVDCPPAGGATVEYGYPGWIRAFEMRTRAFPQMLVYASPGAAPIVADLEMSSISDGTTVHALSFEQQQTLVHTGQTLLEAHAVDTASCAAHDRPERLDFVTGNVSHPYLFNTACMTPDTTRVISTLLCAMRGKQTCD